MSLDRLISVLAALTLFVMMVAIGTTVRWADLRATAGDVPLLLRASLANYVAVPALTLALASGLGIAPGHAAGFMMLAVCPGAPFAPSIAALARADVAAATGLMAALAASSALVAPVLLGLLLPIVMQNDGVEVDAMAVASTLLLTQLLPLFAALVVHEKRPALAARLRPLTANTSRALGAATVVCVVIAHAGLLASIAWSGLAAMAVLLGSTLAAGWWAGHRGQSLRRASALTTSLRNVGAALAIAGGAGAGREATTAILAYFFVEVLGSVAVAWRWRAAGSA